jgi:CheY-like chemotaxis protein
VDDDKDDIFLMSRSLKRLATKASMQFEVSAFHSGQDAYSFFRQIEPERSRLPDCICLDVNMPGIDGIELLKLLRGMLHLADVPIYIISTTTSQKLREQALTLGANGTFTKPDTMADMQAMHRQLLGIPD